MCNARSCSPFSKHGRSLHFRMSRVEQGSPRSVATSSTAIVVNPDGNIQLKIPSLDEYFAKGGESTTSEQVHPHDCNAANQFLLQDPSEEDKFLPKSILKSTSTTNKKKMLFPPTEKSALRVRFCSQVNEVLDQTSIGGGYLYHNYYNKNDEEHDCHLSSLSSLWYSQPEIARFRRDNVRNAIHLQQLHERLLVSGRQAWWFEYLQDVYQEFCNAPHEDHSMQVLLSCNKNFDGTFLGLEHMVLQTLLCDRTRRQDALQEQVHYWQSSTLVSNAQKPDLMANICQELSRPSVLLARYLAHVVAAEEI